MYNFNQEVIIANILSDYDKNWSQSNVQWKKQKLIHYKRLYILFSNTFK